MTTAVKSEDESPPEWLLAAAAESGYGYVGTETRDGGCCLYDELFGFDPRTGEICEADLRAHDAIETTSEAIRQFALRQYGREYNRKDREHSAAIAHGGNAGIKLAYVLLMLTNEDSLREIITSRAAKESALDAINPALARERMRKAVIFYRVLSIATRSLFETPFTEVTSPTYVLMFLEICIVAWACMDAAAMSMYCDFFSARWKFDLRCDDGGLFDRDVLYPPLATARDILADRENFGSTKTSGGQLAVISTRKSATFSSADASMMLHCELRGADAISARAVADTPRTIPIARKVPPGKRRISPTKSPDKKEQPSADNVLHPPLAKRPKLIFLDEAPASQKSSKRAGKK